MTMKWFSGDSGSPGQEMAWFSGSSGSPGLPMTWDPALSLGVEARPLDWIELEIDRCQLTYGVAPCQAQLGVTGSDKCVNSLATCQDPENYDPAPYWVRFAEPIADLPRLAAFADDGVPWWLPALERVRHTPVKPDPGRSIGVRADVRVALQDTPYHDRGIDKYVDERGFDPATRSTLWLKLITRFPFYVGRRLRWHRGLIGGQTTTREYVLERIEGPDRRGKVELVAKDPLKLADPDRAQAPKPSQGQLDQEIEENVDPTSIDIITTDLTEYPSSGGIVFIGGEGWQYTGITVDAPNNRVTLTGVTRDLPGGYVSERRAHDIGDTVQLALFYDTQRLVDIVADLLVNYVPRFDATWISTLEWDVEYDTWLSGLRLTRLIAEPEGVQAVINEIVEQTLTWAFWWDDAARRVRYRAIRPPDVDEPIASLSDDRSLIAGTVERIDEPDRIVNIVQVIYGQIDPTKDRDERENYRKLHVRADADSLSTQQLGQQRIRRIFARWYPSAGADAFVAQFTSRTLFGAAAKSFRLELDVTRDAGENLKLASFASVDTHWIIDELGLPAQTRMQIIYAAADRDVIRLRARADVFGAERTFARIAPGALTGQAYVASSEDQRERYFHVADAAGLMSDRSSGYRLL